MVLVRSVTAFAGAKVSMSTRQPVKNKSCLLAWSESYWPSQETFQVFAAGSHVTLDMACVTCLLNKYSRSIRSKGRG